MIRITTSCRCCVFFFFQAEDGIRDLVRSRGLGDVYKRQGYNPHVNLALIHDWLNQLGGAEDVLEALVGLYPDAPLYTSCLLYTSDAADERSSVDLGGRRIIKKKKEIYD